MYQKRILLGLVSIGLLSLMLIAMPALGGPLPQAASTAQAQTLEHAIQELFTQTAQAAEHMAPSLTAAANITATAAFAQTIEAGFNAALTATARAENPLQNLKAALVNELDILSAPASTSSYLLPDGERFVHKKGREFCVYTIAGAVQQCGALPEEESLPESETVRVSPDGKYLVITTDFTRTFRDADIWLFDVETGAVTNLTDDNTIEADIIRGEGRADIDLSPVWMNDSQHILFMRYVLDSGETSRPQIMIVALDGTATKLGELAIDSRFATYVLALSPDNTQIAFNSYNRDKDDGLWVAELSGANPRQLFSASTPPEVPAQIHYSPNGRYILYYDAMSRNLTASYDAEFSSFKIIPAAGGAPQLIDNQHFVAVAGWAPSGAGLAYLVLNRLEPETVGLYLKTSPDEAGRLVLPGEMWGTTSLQSRLFWAGETILTAARGGRPTMIIRLEAP